MDVEVDAGVGDGDVESSERGDSALDRSSGSRAVRNITSHERCPAPCCSDLLARRPAFVDPVRVRVLADVGADDGGTLARVAECDRAPVAAGRTRDESHLALEPARLAHEHSPPSTTSVAPET
jgi:hypothetical protein